MGLALRKLTRERIKVFHLLYGLRVVDKICDDSSIVIRAQNSAAHSNGAGFDQVYDALTVSKIRQLLDILASDLVQLLDHLFVHRLHAIHFLLVVSHLTLEMHLLLLKHCFFLLEIR